MKRPLKRKIAQNKPTRFGERLITAMEARGVTRDDLARATFRTPQAVSNWVFRSSLSTDMVAALADHLRVRAAWLAFGEGDSGLGEQA